MRIKAQNDFGNLPSEIPCDPRHIPPTDHFHPKFKFLFGSGIPQVKNIRQAILYQP